jgi:lipopolysaccharide/colanic/teichoic acid biosynthesis glycosyltransferase
MLRASNIPNHKTSCHYTMTKRTIDICGALVGLLILSPILLGLVIAVWLSDRYFPLYIAKRVGKDGVYFKMIKLRTMVQNAESSGVDSTAANDQRITAIGRLVRRFKIDEFYQLINVLQGNMSLVGPRPNVGREVALYTNSEKRLLSVKPGITDFSSIVFADLDQILLGSADADIAYNQLVRPWKSRLGIFYITHSNVFVDFCILFLTFTHLLHRSWTLKQVHRLLRILGADDMLLAVAQRTQRLVPTPPLGASSIVTSREEEKISEIAL